MANENIDMGIWQLDNSGVCMVCGQCMSIITVYRKWLDTLVRSDECADCFEYMNKKTGTPVSNFDAFVLDRTIVIDISVGDKYRAS